MGKAKGKWLLALLALAFAAILAAVLCMNFPMAEVHAETAVAKVTAATGETQTYEKLSDAFKAAKDGDTVTLLCNAEITERIVIENKSVVFDLGEYTLTMDEDFSADYSVALRAGTNGILTIEAGTNGTIDAQNAYDYLVPVAAMASGSRVIIKGGTIIVNTAYESCVYAGGGGTVMIEDGVFKNLCQEPFAYVQDGSSPALAVNISDSYTDGGAYLTINGGTFVGRNPMLGDTNPGVTSSYMGSDVNIAQLSDGNFAAVGADDPLPEDTEYFYTEKDGEIVVTVYTPEALAAAVAGDETFADNTFTVVRLGAAIEQGITIADGRVLTLDLNGFTLSNTAGSHTITNSGTLTIIDGGENGEVTNTSAGKAVILNNGEMTLAGGKYTRTADHYVIDNNKGNMTIEAGVTVESPSTLSSMIRNGGDNNAVGATPTLTINGGSFSGGLNTIKNDDYGILHINGGSFSNTTQHVILNWSTATIEGGTFTPQNDAYAAVWTGTWYTSANFTQGVTVIEDGIFNGAVTTGIGKGAPQTTAKADYTISGGTFNAEVNSSADDIGYITGGEFAELPDASAFAPGYVAADPDGDGIYTTVDEAQGDYAVSMTFDNKRAVYESLADALAAAPTDGTEATITLLDNVNENVTIAEGQNITLDLNGKTLTNSGDSHTIYNNGTLRVVGNGTVDNINHGRAALVNYGTAVLDGGKFTRSKEDGKSDSNSWYVILNQGTMTVNDGVSVYTAQEVSNFSSLFVNGLEKAEYPLPIGKDNAYLTVNGGSFMGGVAAIKNDYYGILEVTGGTFGGTGTNTALQNWGEAEISGDAVFEQNVEAYTWLDNYTKGTTTISGGTFLGKVVAREYTSDPDDEDPVVYDKNNVAISGGTFTEPVPAAYMEKGFTLTVNDGTYGVKEAEEVASVTRGEAVYNFATLAEALAFAEDGDMVALLKPATLSETLVIDKAVTLDLGSNALSVNVAGGVGIRIVADNVTVTGGTGGTISATADTVFAVYVNGAKGVLLEGVTIEAHDVAVRAEYDASVKLQNSVIDVTVIENGGSANAIEIICSDMEIIDSVVTCVAEPTTLTGTVCTAIFIEGTYGSDREAAAAADPATYSHLKISGNNTKITARAYAIVGNGTLHGTDIDILGGTIESTNSIAIYHPQVGELTISGNTQITGCSGLEMRAGSLVIEGDGVSVTATDPFMESPLSDGFRFAGVAVGVSRYFAEEGTGVSVSIEGGTFTATNEEGYAFYEKVDEEHAPAVTPDNQDNLSVSIAGGTFEGKVESTNVTGFISGGMFKYRPAEDYMDPDFVTELQNGYYVPVESSALRAAQTNAQADVREYVAMLGMKWAEVLELEGEGDENAVALVAAYNAIADTTSEKGVAEARLKAMDAADAFAAQEDAWEQAKADKIAELESWRDENANGLIIPLYIYTAMNSAADEEELNSYFEQAKAEIGDIYAYRNQITAQSEDLQTLKDTLTALNGALTGENNSFDELLANVEEAIGKAQSAIIGTDADSDSLAGIRDYLEKTINAALEGIDDAISGTNGIASELAGISDVLNGFTSKLDTITGALDEETGWIAEAIEKAQGDITSILAALDSLADGTDIEAIADSLAQILEDIAAVQGTVDEIEGEVSAVSSVQEAKDEALTDIGEWLNNYLDSIIGGTDEANGGAAVALAFTAETTDGDIYAKLTKVFSEDNAQLVLRYYNEALASIDAATTVSEVTTAVSTFKAQVASVEAAAQNTTNLTGLYVLLVIVLVAVVVVLVIVIVKKNRSAEAAEQPAEEAEQPVPAEAVPAAEPEQPEPAAEENELAAEADDDKEQVVIAANVRSFSEAYVELNEELLDLFNKVKEYALAKDGAAEVKQSNGICIKRNGKQIVKLTVRRGYPVALFFLENEMLKDFRRTTNTNAKLKIRATELVLREAADLEAAYTMVDLSVEQIDKDIENAKERRREARRARRKQKQLEEEAQQQEIAAGSAENGENERP